MSDTISAMNALKGMPGSSMLAMAMLNRLLCGGDGFGSEDDDDGDY